MPALDKRTSQLEVGRMQKKVTKENDQRCSVNVYLNNNYNMAGSKGNNLFTFQVLTAVRNSGLLLVSSIYMTEKK